MTKTRSRARELDQFYTDRPLADALVVVLAARLHARGLTQPAVLEPSAGEGAFIEAVLAHLPDASMEACDLEPKHPLAVRQDFFDRPAPPVDRRVAVVGNPPFGKNATLAIRFFNHAAAFADTIAFIVPRTFEKASVKNRLDPRFVLQQEVAIDPLSFHFEGVRVPVPCVFQIWERLPEGDLRPTIATPTSHPDFRFLKQPEGAAFAFQRVGAQAGRIKPLTAANLAPPSHYFLAPANGLSAADLQARLAAVDWQPIKARTAGNPSISKAELIDAYEAVAGLQAAVA